MSKQKYIVIMSAVVEIDSQLLDAVLTDNWRKQFYDFQTPADVVGHLAFNLVRGAELANLDGFADQPPERASIDEIDVDDVLPIAAPKKSRHG